MLHIASHHRSTSRGCAGNCAGPGRWRPPLAPLASGRGVVGMSSPPWLSLRSQPRLCGWQSGKSLALVGVLAIAQAGPPSCRFAHRKATCPCAGPPWQSLRSQPRLCAQLGMRAVRWRCCAAAAHANAPTCRISAFALRLVSCGFPGIGRSIQARGVLAQSSPDFAQFRRGRIGHFIAGVRRWRLMLARSSERDSGDGETKYFRCQMGSPAVLSH